MSLSLLCHGLLLTFNHVPVVTSHIRCLCLACQFSFCLLVTSKNEAHISFSHSAASRLFLFLADVVLQIGHCWLLDGCWFSVALAKTVKDGWLQDVCATVCNWCASAHLCTILGHSPSFSPSEHPGENRGWPPIRCSVQPHCYPLYAPFPAASRRVCVCGCRQRSKPRRLKKEEKLKRRQKEGNERRQNMAEPGKGVQAVRSKKCSVVDHWHSTESPSMDICAQNGSAHGTNCRIDVVFVDVYCPRAINAQVRRRVHGMK